jgi:regulator of replication initiation timing
MVSSMADEKMEFEKENENIKKQYEEVKGVCTQLEEQTVAFKQQIQKLVQTNDIYEIDSKKMKQSLDASTR